MATIATVDGKPAQVEFRRDYGFRRGQVVLYRYIAHTMFAEQPWLRAAVAKPPPDLELVTV